MVKVLTKEYYNWADAPSMKGYVPPSPDPAQYILDNYNDNLWVLIKGGTTIDMSNNHREIHISGGIPNLTTDQRNNNNMAYTYSGLNYLTTKEYTGSVSDITVICWAKNTQNTSTNIIGLSGISNDSKLSGLRIGFGKSFRGDNNCAIVRYDNKYDRYQSDIDTTSELVLNNWSLFSISSSKNEFTINGSNFKNYDDVNNLNAKLTIKKSLGFTVDNNSNIPVDIGFVALWTKHISIGSILDIYNNTK